MQGSLTKASQEGQQEDGEDQHANEDGDEHEDVEIEIDDADAEFIGECYQDVKGGNIEGAEEGQQEQLEEGEFRQGQELCDLLYRVGQEAKFDKFSKTICQGTVEKFAPKRGFGIIKPIDGSAGVFAHWTQICSDDKWPRLTAGMHVLYSTAVSGGKIVAENITTLDGCPITMENGQPRELSPFTVTGTVSSFNKAGYGFVAIDEPVSWPTELPAGATVYVSREELVVEDGSVCNLSPGMRIRFRLFKPEDEDKPASAAEVTALDGQPIAVETSLRKTPAAKGKGKGKGSFSSLSPKLVPTVSAAQAYAVQKSIRKPDLKHGKRIRKYLGETTEDVGMDEGQLPEMAALCTFYITGVCDKGSACQFVHGKDEEPMAESLMSVPDPQCSTQMCKYFLAGICSKGALCQYRHEALAGSPVASGVIDCQQQVSDTLSVCKFYLAGICSKGDACQYRHGTGDALTNTLVDALAKVRQAATLHRDATKHAIEAGGMKSLPCKFFARGCCSKGMACQFSHTLEDDGSLYATKAIPKKTIPVACKFFAVGQCAKGINCEFLHDPNESDDAAQAIETASMTRTAEPCKFFQMGRCNRGSACAFSHELSP